MTQRVLQNSFLGGELSPAMFGRTDNDIYTIGAGLVENFLIQPQGSIISRQGSQYVMTAPNCEKNVRLIPFRFASDQTLVLVFSDRSLQIVTHGKILLDENNDPYVVDTPYRAEDLFDLDFCQNADIITITCVNYPPMELRRYGATDWRFVEVTTAPNIKPPEVFLKANYPAGTDGSEKEKVTARYVVTSIDDKNKESIASKPETIKCNYYLTGGSVTVSWSKVQGATRYRVYRDVCGIFGFIGETSELSVIDIGDTPDGTTTPPRYDKPFTASRGITEVEVIKGGSGYDEVFVPTLPRKIILPPIFVSGRCEHDYDETPFTRLSLLIDILDANDNFNVVKTIVKPLRKVAFKYVGKDKYDSPIYDGITCPVGCTKDGFSIDLGDINVNNPAIKINRIRSSTNTYPSSGRYIDRFYEKTILIPGGVKESYTNSGSRDAYLIGDTALTQPFIKQIISSGVDFNDYTFDGNSGLSKEDFTNMVDGYSLHTLQVLSRAFSSDKGYLRLSDLEELNNIGFENEVVQPTKLVVEDKTGVGAQLRPIIKDGVIVSVEIISAGGGYTDPKIKVISKTGTGAELKAYVNDGQILSDLDYPSTVTQYDQRRIFAGSLRNPLKVWMTNAGQQDLMMFHLPLQDDDRIDVVAVTSDADKIRHAVALDSLILFTSSGELRVFTQNSDALTPRSVTVRAQSYIGANNVQPVIVNNAIFYVASRGGHVRAVQFAYESGGYTSTDLSLIANHLFDYKDIVDLTLSKAPIQNVFAVSSTGEILALTVYPEQNISCWSRIKTDGKYLSCCAVSEGKEDHLYVVVEREIKGKKLKYVERFSTLTIKNNKDSRNLDSFIEGQNLKSTLAGSNLTLSGLSHLEGKTVTAFVDGQEYTDLIVRNGSITVPASGSNVVVGLPYKCSLITLPLSSSVARGNLQGSIKNINEVHVRVSKDGDLFANNYPQDILFKATRDDSDLSDDSSKMLKLSLSGSWDMQGQLIFEHRNALPLEIQAIVGNVRLEGAK